MISAMGNWICEHQTGERAIWITLNLTTIACFPITQVWWHEPSLPPLGRQRQEDHSLRVHWEISGGKNITSNEPRRHIQFAMTAPEGEREKPETQGKHHDKEREFQAFTFSKSWKTNLTFAALLKITWISLEVHYGAHLLSVFLAVSSAVFWFHFQLCKRSPCWRWAPHVVVGFYFRGQVLLRDKRICTACLKCYICAPHHKKSTPQSTGDRIQWRTASYECLTADKRGPTACQVFSGKGSRENQDSAITDSWWRDKWSIPQRCKETQRKHTGSDDAGKHKNKWDLRM